MSGRHAPRSRTGCSTCRSRKVKCDEAQPSCMRCRCAQVRCEWLRVARRSRPKVKTPNSTDGDGLEGRHYQPLLPRSAAPAYGVALDSLSLPSSLLLSAQDREYLAFFPHSSMARWIGKPWKWSSLNYVHRKIAPHSSVVMRMILAIAATELEGIRYNTSNGPMNVSPQRRWESGAGYYRDALRDFQGLLGKLHPPSVQELNEILAAFFLMTMYEHQFSPDTVGLEVHIRGVYTFLRANGFNSQSLAQPELELPGLGQQLLLLVIYINLYIIRHDGTMPGLWEEAGHESPLLSVLDYLFYNSRNTRLSMWPVLYPTEEVEDDASVFRPLELFNECNKLKYRLRLLAERPPPATEVDATRIALASELGSVGRRFQDLITLSQRSDAGLRKRQLQTIFFVVAEYHAIELLFHQTFCPEGSSCHQGSSDAAMGIFERLSKDDDSKLGRVLWPMVVVGELTSNERHRHWLHDALLRTQNWGLFECVNRWRRRTTYDHFSISL